MCKPPPNTAEETLHMLSAYGEAAKPFLWRNGLWTTPGTPYGTKPSAMTALGWRYVGPAPEVTS